MAIRISGMVSGLDTDSMVQELVASYSKKTEKYEKAKTKLEWKQEAWKELNTKIYDLYSKTVSNLRFSKSFNKKSTTVSDESKATVSASTSAVKGTQTLEIKSLAASGYLTGAELRKKGETQLTASSKLSDLGIAGQADITIKVGDDETKTITLGADMTISDLTKQLGEYGVTANFDAANQRFFISSSETGEDYDFNLGGDADALKKLGLSSDAGAVKLDGTDAEIVLNGATFKSNTNSFSINGLTITAKEVTEDKKPIKLVTDTNVDDVYDTIKEFITKYNELINEMDSLYNADSAKGYEPLTDDEKEAMSEKEIEKWEEKIKDSLLRRDSTLNSVASVMKTAMQKTFEVNGTKMSLSSFGIGTGSYLSMKENEKNALHINGDEEDDITSGNEDKLRKMIASDPDTVADFFSQLANNLYDELGDKMKSTTLSSAFTVYNDKQMKDEIKEYEEKISKWEDYVTEQEEYWYSKFTAMEKALSELQSSTSALSGLLGS